MNTKLALISTAAIFAAVTAGIVASGSQAVTWTEQERQRIASLSLSNLPALPPDPSNAVADVSAAAASPF